MLGLCNDREKKVGTDKSKNLREIFFSGNLSCSSFLLLFLLSLVRGERERERETEEQQKVDSESET